MINTRAANRYAKAFLSITKSVSKKEDIVDPSNTSKLSFAKDVPFIPFIKMKYEIEVKATPPKTEKYGDPVPSLVNIKLKIKPYPS